MNFLAFTSKCRVSGNFPRLQRQGHHFEKHREHRSRRRRNGLIGRTSILNDDSMAACGILAIFMTRNKLDSLSEVSCDSNKPKKMTTE